MIRSTRAPRPLEAEALEKLRANLSVMGLPAWRGEARGASRVADQRRDPSFTEKRFQSAAAPGPAVVLLAPPSLHKLSILREGGRQAPGDVHLVLDPSWLILERGRDGRNRLRMSRGLYFEGPDQPVLAEYVVPRPVGYFANYFTMATNGRHDGAPFEEDLDVPMSHSMALDPLVNDKLLTRLLLAAAGVAVPRTFAFPREGHALALVRGAASPLVELAWPEAGRLNSRLKAQLADFLARLDSSEVVVKPSGGSHWHSGRGVRFFPRREAQAITEHAQRLLQDERLGLDGAALVEERLEPPPLYLRYEAGGGAGGYWGSGKTGVRLLEKREIPAALPGDRKDWNLRVLCARWELGEAVINVEAGRAEGGSGACPEAAGAGVVCAWLVRAGPWGLPTSAEPARAEDAAGMILYEDAVLALRRQHGLLSEASAELDFRAAVEGYAEKALGALARYEAGRRRGPGEPYRARTDYIGLDVMAAWRGERLIPYVIEVNDHDSGGQWPLDALCPERVGEHSRAWIATMLARARAYAMEEAG